MTTLAWLGAFAIGLSLGLLGSGGSILTVPVLLYLVGQDEKVAIGGSLFVVGAIAAAGGIQYAWKRQVDWRSVLWFGVPGMVGTYGGAALGGLVSGTVQLAVFALVMLAAAGLMIKPPRLADRETEGAPPTRSRWKIVSEGLAVGVLTGFVGVGGGFLIVPALVLLGGLPMSLAVGTSLVIIALKSFTGFIKYLDVLSDLDLALDWSVLASVSVIGLVGSFAGRRLGGRISDTKLRRVFAVFLVLVGLWILVQSVPDLF
jgi:uncharacterized membrane protein YfcA